jgi:hypothetical protein
MQKFKFYIFMIWKIGLPNTPLFQLVGARALRTLWSPPVSLNQKRHTQRRKAANFIFI